MNEHVHPRGIPPSHEEILAAISLFNQKCLANSLTADEITLGMTLTRVMELVFKLRAERKAARNERDGAREALATEQMDRAADQAVSVVTAAKAQAAARTMMVVADKRQQKNDMLLTLMQEVLKAGGLPKPLMKKIAKVLSEQA